MRGAQVPVDAVVAELVRWFRIHLLCTEIPVKVVVAELMVLRIVEPNFRWGRGARGGGSICGLPN